MCNNLNLRTADWRCPDMDSRTVTFSQGLLSLNRKTADSFCNVDSIRRMVEEAAEEMRKKTGESRYILPVWQNLESVVYGIRIMGGNPGDTGAAQEKKPAFSYCVSNLKEIRNLDFSLLSDPMIRAVIHTVPYYREKPLVLEVEAPFSVLGALMNPMDLYLCMEEEEKLLLEILHKIADTQAEYIGECVKEGCRIISLADPVGTMDLVGEKAYKAVSGESEIRLLEQCDKFLDQAVIHICRKMSQSLLIAGMAEAKRYPEEAGFMDTLLRMADDPAIHFTGMTCMHGNAPGYMNSCIMRLR